MKTAAELDPAAILEPLVQELQAAIVVCDGDQRITWKSDEVEGLFPGRFPHGALFDECLANLSGEELEPPLDGSAPSSSHAPPNGPREFRVDAHGQTQQACYRLLPFAIDSREGACGHVHCFVDVSREKELESTYKNSLAQLVSLREISDTLYESLSTEEVIYLILIAVTAHVGFGFNRAFYLEATGDHLRGSKGIGPASPEEAHAIWASLASQNHKDIRALHRDASSRDRVPDEGTHALAGRMNFALEADEESRLVQTVRGSKPGLLRQTEALGAVDRELFELLNTDIVAIVPLYVRHSLVGVLIADNFITRNEITRRDLDILKTFSRYAGLALERSQLYDELRLSVTKLQDANETLKTHQRKLLQAEKLSAIGELAACVSHEIRNPLVAIGGLANSLSKEEGLDPSQRETLCMITDQVTRLEKFLRETLDFVKPEVHGAVSSEIRDEIDSCVSTLKRELESRSIELTLDLGDEPLRCLLAADLFHRSLTNLVLNAMQAIDKCGRIHISTRHEGHHVAIEVADTGPGIPAELHSRVFDPFFTTKPEGTGLGLANAAQAIRTLGGQISLQANEAYRTIFRILLPLEANLVRNLPRLEGRNKS